MEDIMFKCKNYFYKFKEYGDFKIVGNKLMNTKGTYFQGQYIRILNSVMNNGVYIILEVKEDGIILDGDLTTEVFNGVVCGLAIPKGFIKIARKIEGFDNANRVTNITSESVTGYSHSRATNSQGNVMRGYDIFKDDLRPYRKMYEGLEYVEEVR